MPQTAAVFDVEGEAMQAAFDDLHADGYRLVSISTFGPADVPRYAALWHQTWGPRQTLERGVPWSDLPAKTTQYQAKGMSAALVAALAHPAFILFAVVFEELTLSPDQQEPRLAFAGSGAEMHGKIHGAHPGLFTRSVAAAGRRRDPDQSWSGADPWYVAVLWPQPAGIPWHSRGFRVDPEDPDWRFQWPTIVMRSHAHVAIAGGATTRSGEPDGAFSVWTDERYDPWPEQDPFAIDPMAIGDLLRVDRGSLEAILSLFTSRENQGYFPLSLSAHGGAVASATWHAVWAPPHAWTPLRRRFVVQGPGDGSNRADHVGTHIRSAARSLGRAQRAGRRSFLRVADLYDVRELRPGHLHLRPLRTLGATPGSTFRDLDPQAGGGGSSYETAGSTPELSAGGGGGQIPQMHQFDALMKRIMMLGVRSAYLVVLRRGELKYARAYTFAEEGYPIATIDNRFRVASVTKSIIGTLVVRQALTIPGGLQANFADALDVEPHFHVLREATVEDALRHATGFATTNTGISTADVLLRANADSTTRALEELGTIRLWYGNTMDSVQVPYEDAYRATGERTSAYNNWVYACLGEMFAMRAQGVEDYGGWPEAVAGQLQRAGSSLENAMGGRSYRACRELGEVLYHATPGVSPRRWTSFEEPLPFVPVSYDQDIDALGCATAIVISPIDMARFLAALTPRPGRFKWLSKNDLPLLYSHDPTIPDSSGGGLGWGHSPSDWNSNVAGSTVVRHTEQLHFTGELTGTRAYIQHLVPHDPAHATDTFSFAIALATHIASTPLIDRVRTLAQAIEDAGAWPAGDLLDGM